MLDKKDGVALGVWISIPFNYTLKKQDGNKTITH